MFGATAATGPARTATVDAIEAILRDPNQPTLHTETLAAAARPILILLCRRFALPATGNMASLRQRLLLAAATLDRDAIARAAFYGMNGYEAVDAHLNAVLGYEHAGAWHTATNAALADALRVIGATDDATLRLLIPGGAFSTPYGALIPLFAIGGRQYAEVSSGSTIVFRTQTSSFRFYCAAGAWLASTAMREMRQHYHPTPTT